MAAADAAVDVAASAYLAELLSLRECAACAVPAGPAPAAPAAPRAGAAELRAYVAWACAAASAGGAALTPQAMAAYALLARAQREHSVWGAVGELRSDVDAAPAGHSLALAALLARGDEPLLLADGACSGGAPCPARAASLRAQLVKAGLGAAAAAALAVVGGGAPPPPAPRFGCAAGAPRFRWLVLDGARSAEQTRRDLAAAACSLADGGIVAVSGWVLGVDDVSPTLVKNVAEGLFDFMAVNSDRLAPFLQMTGQVFLTTPGHQRAYFDAARWLEGEQAIRAYSDPNKAVLFGAEVVSHSVPDDAAIRLSPDAADAVADTLLAAAGLA